MGTTALASALGQFTDWFTWDSVAGLVRVAASIALVVVGVALAIRLADILVTRALRPKPGQDQRRRMDERRLRTLATLIQSCIRYVFYFVGGLTILQLFNVPITSVLATAGIGGLALGFGAQSLVRDVITGFFLVFEGQFGVGDYIQAAGVEGIVEEMGLRVTRIRDFGGQLHIIPNGQITQVTNFMGSGMRVMFEVGISYEADVDRAIQVLQERLDQLAAHQTEVLGEVLIVEGPKVLGVSALSDSSVSLLIWAKAKPMGQWQVERELRKACKQALEQAGISIPYPHVHLVWDETSHGPVPLRVLSGGPAASAGVSPSSEGVTRTAGGSGGERKA